MEFNRELIHQKLDEALDIATTSPENIKGLRVSQWDGLTKDADNNPQVTKLVGVQLQVGLKENEVEFVQQAAPTIIKPLKAKKPLRTDTRTFIVSDAQVPYNDPQATEACLTGIRESRPDRVVVIGDFIDLPSLSRYEQRPEWARSTQEGVDESHSLLARIRANAPDAKIDYLGGNHELRLESYVRKNAAELLGIRRANAAHELGVLTIPFLLRLDELEIDYHGGFPNGRLWLEDNLQAIHGKTVRSNGSTASAVVRQHDVSTIFGHVHRIEVASRAIGQRKGAKFVVAATFGTLANIDGNIPSGSYSTDDRGEVLTSTPNWQQGFGIIDHNERVHQINSVHVIDGSFSMDGKRY